jgi:hypothetical protein
MGPSAHDAIGADHPSGAAAHAADEFGLGDAVGAKDVPEVVQVDRVGQRGDHLLDVIPIPGPLQGVQDVLSRDFHGSPILVVEAVRFAPEG